MRPNETYGFQSELYDAARSSAADSLGKGKPKPYEDFWIPAHGQVRPTFWTGNKASEGQPYYL